MTYQRSHILALVLKSTVGFHSQMAVWGYDPGWRLIQVVGCDEDISKKSGFVLKIFPTDFAK